MTFVLTDEPRRGGRIAALRRDRWAAALITLVWAQGVIPPTVRSLTAPKLQLSLTATSTASTNPLVNRADTLLTYGEMGCALLIILVFGWSAQFGRISVLLLGLLPWIYIAARDAYDGNPLSKRELVYPLIVLAIWILRPQLRHLRPLAYLVTATALLSIAMGLFIPAKGLLINADTSSTAIEEKQIFGQGILIGPFNQGNQLGLYLVIGLASLALVEHRGRRLLMLVVCGYALLWTAARSSLGVAAVLALAVVVFSALGRRSRVIVGVGMTAAVTVVVCATPIITHDPEGFTNRGFIWDEVFKGWGNSRLFGLGTNWFAQTAASSSAIANSAYDAHNQFLQLLTTGGIVLAVCVGLMLLAVTVAAVMSTRDDQLFGLYFVLAVIGAGWLEATFGFVDRMQLAAVAIVPMAFLLFEERRPPVDAQDGPGPVGETRATANLDTRGRQAGFSTRVPV